MEGNTSAMEVVKGIYYDTMLNLHYPEGATQMYNFPEELREVVNDHWSQFPPQHPLVADIFGILFFVLTVVNFIANSLVIYVYLGTEELKTPANMLMVNLAISDLCIFCSQGPALFINAFAADFWMYGTLWCKLYGCTGGIFGTCSIITLVFIAYDRYHVIVFGIAHAKQRITTRKAALIIAFIWTYSVVACIPPFFGWGGYKLEGLFMSCSYEYLSDDWNHKSFVLFAFIWNFCIPFTFLCVFYEKIIVAIFFQEAALKRAQTKLISAKKPPLNAREWHIEVKCSKVALMNVLCWLISWLPYAIVVMTGAFGNRANITPLVSQIPSFMCKLGSCLNPVVMIFSHPKYRNALSDKCPWLGIRKVDVQSPEEIEAEEKISTILNEA